MNKTAILALTPTGIKLAKRLKSVWKNEAAVFVPESKKEPGLKGFPTGSFKPGIQLLFKQYDALICIMATGIVVRSLCEILEDKCKDPAVIVMDEQGQYVISLLSGHVGGGNQLAREIAAKISGFPVITTATDVQGVTALDLLAKEINGWYLDFKQTTKKINSLLADHQKVGLIQRENWVKDQRGLTLIQDDASLTNFAAVVLVSDRNEKLDSDKLIQVVPRHYILGIGARKGIAFIKLKEEYLLFCQLANVHFKSIKKVVSIDLKQAEPGICQLAAWLDVPFTTYSAAALCSVADKYPQSAFVKQTTGVGNISQAAADLASQGHVITERYARRGITFALGEDEVKSCYMS